MWLEGVADICRQAAPPVVAPHLDGVSRAKAEVGQAGPTLCRTLLAPNKTSSELS
jgi:hypothetical protein